MQTRRLIPLLVVVLLAVVVSPGAGQAGPPTPPAPRALEALAQDTGGHAQVSRHSQTGRVKYVGTDPAHPIHQPAALDQGATPEQAARGFLTAYGAHFGLANQSRELKVLSSKSVDRGRSFVRFQQMAQDIPVLGGELVVQTDAGNDIISASGEILPDPQFSADPTLDAESALQTAREAIGSEYKVEPGRLKAAQPELWLYNPAILGGPGPQITRLVWRTEVTLDEPAIRELVLVDAHLGGVALHFSEIDTLLNRQIYDNNNDRNLGLPGYGPVRIEGGAASAVADVNSAYDNAGVFYNFYLANHARDSIDGAGMPLVATVRYCPPSGACPYPNAFWDGSRMVYGSGYASGLDVVAHEMTHGVTDHESRLFYIYQSGAINESFSDVWGEIIEHWKNPAADPQWRIGEDIPGGAIRSMSDPTAFGDPDKIPSANYNCDPGLQDNGGVHTNSGVNNKAAWLLAHGGTFEGATVRAIGLTKTAKIYYEVQSNLLTSAGDYQDLYSSLQQACYNLAGYGDITTADCGEVKKALDAVHMNEQPASCASAEAPVCGSGEVATDLFSDDLENPALGNWVKGPNSFFYYPQNPNPYAGAIDPTYATSGRYNIWGVDRALNADYYIAMTRDVTVPAGKPVYLRFNHAFFFRRDASNAYDGGVVEYSTNQGATWTDAGPLFPPGTYNVTLAASPLTGRPAFGRVSNGYISSRADLRALAGQRVRFRFRIGSSTRIPGDMYGWFIDDVRAYSCAPPPAGYQTYLPSVLRGAQSALGIPTLLPIDVAPGTSIYTVDWNAVSQATVYELQEDDRSSFSSPSIVYRGAETSWSSGGKTSGTYYYRVRGVNSRTTGDWSNVQSVTVADLGGWQSLISATFEGEFPGPWALYDTTDPPTGYVWGKRSCRSFAGSNSAWAVGGGSNGAALACGANYPDNVDSWLDYGPFSTVGISAGQFSTKAWTNTEYNAVDNEPVDTLCRMASIDGANYSGWCLGGDSRKTAGNVNGWIDARVLDLSQVPEVQDDGSIKWINMLGQPRVWVAIVFSSDSSITFDEGAYVDNTVLRLCPSGSSCPGAGPTLAPEANGGVREVAAHMVRPANKR